jgi:hypothetical protein
MKWPKKRKETEMATSLKIEKFPGVARVAPERIERHEQESALRNAAFVRDAHMHDLHVEFSAREAKIRQAYLDAIREIMSEEAE